VGVRLPVLDALSRHHRCSTRSAAITGAVIHVNGGEWMFG
jgi:hypothetical protein